MAKVPLQMSGLAISATPIADRCLKSEHTAMKSLLPNIGSRMACSEELGYFQRGTVIGCHLSNKSICQISAMLELPRATVSAVILKWNRLGATMAQP
jgi:hypothetical protein